MPLIRYTSWPMAEWKRLIMLVMIGFSLSACATWQEPKEINASALRARAVIAREKGVQVRAAVLSTEESKRLLGANVNATNILPIWIEVDNATTQTLWLLRAGADPDYFSPQEVAWPFRALLQREKNQRLNEHFDKLEFRSPVAPGESRNGIIFVNPQYQVLLLTVDLIGQGEFFPFTLFLPVPDDVSDTDVLMPIKRFIETKKPNIQKSDQFRTALEKLPYCATNAAGARVGDPINVVLVGELDDIAAALGRLKFRRVEKVSDSAQRLFSRPPDVVVRKTGQGSMPANWMRIWVAPLRYQNQPVFLVQTGRAIGGRFSESDSSDSKLHPKVDEARNLLIQDMSYSGGLAKLGFLKPSAHFTACTDMISGEPRYFSDGLRAVMFFESRPHDLSDIETLDWHPYLKHQGSDTKTQSSEAHQ
jgi:hypothetical protein